LAPSPLGEDWGEGLSENCTDHVAAGFSPHPSLARVNNGLKPDESFRGAGLGPLPNPLPQGRGSKTEPTD
jgi:hypothetical protein